MMLLCATAVCRRAALLPAARSISSLSASNLVVEQTRQPRPKPKPEGLVFGHEFTDHMLSIPWTAKDGWAAPRIHPLQNLSLHPAVTCLHYALQCFEGMKAYKDSEGNARLFRPDMNMQRFNNSATRLTLPSFDQAALLTLIKKLVALERDWIPSLPNYSLYIRPTLIATTPWLGVAPASDALLYVICSPVGPYYKDFKPVKLYADEAHVRAFPRGTGNYKIGANYGPTILPQQQAAKMGYSQILWIYGPEHEVTEVGTMNLFMHWINEKGEEELITKSLEDGTVLPGVTRNSIIELGRSWGINVREGSFNMARLTRALEEGRVHEVFGAGTAAIVSPVSAIYYQGKEWAIPVDKADPNAGIGPLANRFFSTILSIQTGKTQFRDWSVVV